MEVECIVPLAEATRDVLARRSVLLSSLRWLGCGTVIGCLFFKGDTGVSSSVGRSSWLVDLHLISSGSTMAAFCSSSGFCASGVEVVNDFVTGDDDSFREL